MQKPLFKNVCDENVFSKIYEKLSKDLHDFIYYKYGPEFNPKDKVQEAFIKLWSNCESVPPEKAKSYLFTVINNYSLNQAKHKKVVLKFQKNKPKNYTNESPEFLMQENEYLEKVQRALSKLSEGQREAFLLNRVEGKRHKEIAEILQISRKAVEKRIYTALEKLREDIEEL